MIRVCVAGSTGWTGGPVAQAVEAATDLELVAGVSRSDPASFSSVAEALDAAPADVLVDYTSPAAVKGHVLEAARRGVSAVIGTSGLTEEDYSEIDGAARAAGVGVLAAGNFALTAVLLQRFAEIAARHLPSWEIIDYGKANKPDAPSGTSRELASRLARVRPPDVAAPAERTHGLKEARGASPLGTPVHSVRLPGFVSSIEILFGQPDERLTIRHDSGSGARPYVAGTLLAVRKVAGFAGLRRGLDSVLDL